MVYISAKEKKNPTKKNSCRSKAQSDVQKQKYCSVLMCVIFVVNYICTVNEVFTSIIIAFITAQAEGSA